MRYQNASGFGSILTNSLGKTQGGGAFVGFFDALHLGKPLGVSFGQEEVTFSLSIN